MTPLPNQNFHAQKASSLYGHSRHLDCSALLVRCRRGAIRIHERDGSEQGDITPPVTLNPSHPFPLLRPPTAGTQARTGDKFLVLHSSHAKTPSRKTILPPKPEHATRGDAEKCTSPITAPPPGRHRRRRQAGGTGTGGAAHQRRLCTDQVETIEVNVWRRDEDGKRRDSYASPPMNFVPRLPP